MENEKTVTRKYYKLSERSQANDDLAKAFPDIRTNVSGLQDKVHHFLSAGCACIVIDIFKLEDAIRQTGQMSEDEWLNHKWMEKYPDHEFKKTVVHALVAMNSPKAKEIIAAQKAEKQQMCEEIQANNFWNLDILKGKNGSYMRLQEIFNHFFNPYINQNGWVFFSELIGETQEERDIHRQKMRDTQRILICPLMLEKRLKNNGQMSSEESLGDAWYARQNSGDIMKALINSLTINDSIQGTPKETKSAIQTTLF